MQWPLEAALLVLGFVRVMTNREPCVSMMYDRSLLKLCFSVWKFNSTMAGSVHRFSRSRVAAV